MAIKKPAKIKEPVVPVPVVEIEEDDTLEPVIEVEEDKGGPEKYYETVGRRKESIARVRLYTKKSSDAPSGDGAIVTVNNKNYTEYFTDVQLQHVVESPLRKLKSLNRFKVTAMVHGGGSSGQAGAIKHGVSRALELFDANFRKKLKKSGFLKRDPRAKERRKYGLKKARKAGQWSKR